ncbi:MAG TPA: hypothetical protein VFO52_07370 [Longimicrobiales bacterium]|nr:hypothetical protein [Longimicrobiales bacterium]
MKDRYYTLVGALLVAGCATAPPAAAPRPAGGTILAYRAAAPATLTYDFADSSNFTITGGAIGDIRASMGSRGTAEVVVGAKDSTNVEMRMRITELQGTASNSAMGGTTNVTKADVTGEAVLTVSPRGVLTVNQVPTASRAAQQTGIGPSFFRRFTLRLPSTAVARGSSWTDTVNTSEESAGIRSSVNDVVTATWARDTTVNGKTLHVITHATQRTLNVTGTSEGVEIAQKLSGSASGYTLWDAQRSVVVERFENTELSGTFDLPAMGLSGLPVTAKGSGRITLR